MKRFVVIICSLLIFNTGFSQAPGTKKSTAEFVKNPVMPDFTIYTAPDSTVFTNHDLKKNKPVLLMIFSPECGHCQNETRELEKNMNLFKNVQIVMVTWLPYSEMMAFYHNYKIGEYPQITMGWDKKDFFLPYYHVQMYPDFVAYNKHGKYVNSFSGDIKMEEVAKALNE